MGATMPWCIVEEYLTDLQSYKVFPEKRQKQTNKNIDLKNEYDVARHNVR